MLAITLSLTLLCLSQHMGAAAAAVLMSPRTVDESSASLRPRPNPTGAHTCVEGDPATTLRGVFRSTTSDTTDDDLPSQPSFYHTLTLPPVSAGPSNSTLEQPLPNPTGGAFGGDDGDGMVPQAGPTILVPTAKLAAAAAADMPAPTMTPPPPDADAQRAFREEYGDRYTQVTYWSCATAGVFAGHCGWHMPIIEVANTAASGRAGGSYTAALAAGLVGFVVGGFVLAL